MRQFLLSSHELTFQLLMKKKIVLSWLDMMASYFYCNYLIVPFKFEPFGCSE